MSRKDEALMDTVTHFAMGVGLAGLAYLDPVVASSPGLAEAVMLGTVIGSQAPDLDGLTRLRGSASYIRNHRGVSHSIPALFGWTIAVFLLVQAINPQQDWPHVLGWTFLAVFLHIFVDLFNAYGTQGLSPFSKKWIAFNMIFIFDPLIFGLHLVGFLLWMAGANPGQLFLTIYLLLVVYYYLRYKAHRRTRQLVQKELGFSGEYTILPTFFWNQWTFVVQTDTHWYVGEVNGGETVLLDTFVRKAESEPIIRSKQNPMVQAFLSFTRYAHAEVREHPFGYEVRWLDLRYRARNTDKNHYMLVAVVYLDKAYRELDAFVGWIHRGEEQLAKKLNPNKEIQIN